SRRRHTRWPRDWSSDVCSSDLRHRDRSYGKPDDAQITLLPKSFDHAFHSHTNRARPSSWFCKSLLGRRLIVASWRRLLPPAGARSEERRVGKEGRAGWGGEWQR